MTINVDFSVKPSSSEKRRKSLKTCHMHHCLKKFSAKPKNSYYVRLSCCNTC